MGRGGTTGVAVYPDICPARPIYLSGVECAATRAAEAEGLGVGLLLQPGSHLEKKSARYRVFGADNGCFAKGESFDEEAWITWVEQLPGAFEVPFAPAGAARESRLLGEGPRRFGRLGCAFVVAPDRLCDPEGTWRRAERWLERVREAGFGVAVVAQDGAEEHRAMWDEEERWDALFVGGSTAWKCSEAARLCVREAQLLGKWTHMGRVNSWKRLQLAASWSLDSVDGTFLAFGPDANAGRFLSWLRALAQGAVAQQLFAA